MPILIQNEKFWENISIKSKGIQVIQYLQKSMIKFPSLKDKFDKYINDVNYIIDNIDENFESKKNKILKINSKIIKIVKRKLISKHYYYYFSTFTLFFLGKCIIEIYEMKKILKEKQKDFNIFKFTLMIISLFVPMIIIYFPDFYNLQTKIKIIIFSSSIFTLISIIISIKNLRFFSFIIIFSELINFIIIKFRIYIKFKRFLKGYYQFKLGEILSFILTSLYIILYLKKHFKNQYFD